MDKALQMISQHAEDGAKLRRDFFAVHGGKVAEAARRMAVAVARGGKILLAGNGGSAADAQHWAAEFVNRFLMDRPPLPAIALTTDSSVLTSIGNDFGYDLVFTKQVQALGRPGDVFVGISTSGNSANVIGALQAARKQSLFTIGLTVNVKEADIDAKADEPIRAFNLVRTHILRQKQFAAVLEIECLTGGV